MVVNARIDGDIAILSNFGALLDDPRHFDVTRDVNELLDAGCRGFVLELANIRDVGTTALGLLVTITRQVRKTGGEVVLTRVGRDVAAFLKEMQMEEYWDLAADTEEARNLLRKG